MTLTIKQLIIILIINQWTIKIHKNIQCFTCLGDTNQNISEISSQPSQNEDNWRKRNQKIQWLQPIVVEDHSSIL